RAGLVPGGGVAYLRARAQARVDDMDDPDVAAGVHVLRTAIQAPFLQILANAGIEALPELAKVERLPDWEGLNAASGQYGNLRDMGVVDATSVTCSALRHATSVAGMLLTTECVVTCA
ncbi:MAG TPA: TCP-1/cpn60 chaperonin family protein, partial [Pseudorhodoferax sp.]|nr:TCP-1/cpn60 chaperonin family protein [Pseudorhodoferax sp.]